MLGTLTKVALKKGATWGTAAAPGTGDRTPFVSSTVRPNIQQIENDDLNEGGVRGKPFKASENAAGDLTIDADYRQQVPLLLAALFLGQAGTPTEVEAGLAYEHTLPWQAGIEGLFATMDQEWGGSPSKAHQYASVKPTGRQITWESAGRLRDVYTLLGTGVDRTLGTTPADYAVDPTDGGTLRVLQRQLVVRVNGAADGALGASDEMPCMAGTIGLVRPMSEDYTNRGLLEEPVLDDWGAVTLELTMNAATSALHDLFLEAMHAETPLKADVFFEHDVVISGSSTKRSRTYLFPKLIVSEVPLEIPGPGRLPFSVTMTGHLAQSSPTGFPAGTVAPVTEQWVNEISADPLA